MNEFLCFVSPLVRQAARNLYQLEFISRIPGWINWWYHRDLWCTRRLMAMTPDEAAAWLPALAFAVSRERNAFVLPEFAWWSFPEPLPPEAMPWRDRLIQVWEQYPADTDEKKSICLAALVRLDRRVERLPEWLQEARQAMDMKPENRHLRLAALAGWRPRPGDLPAHGDSREAVLQWGQFWKKLLRNYRSKPDGLIAAAALLHLAEAGWLPGGLSPERLREELRQRVQQWEKTWYHQLLPGMLLASVPAGSPSPEQQDITGWLELTRKDVDWEKRELVWGMLVSWQREGILERCGISLVPDMARTLEWERDRCVLLAMAGYVPKAAEVRAHPKELRAVVACWEALSRSTNSWELYYRRAGWVARWNLLRGRAMTAKKQARFAADYVDAIRSEKAPDVLLVLAQIRPPGPFPLTAWVRRLSDGDDACRLAAGLAMHRWLGEVMEGANGEWRVASGKEASGEWRVASGSSLLATRRRQVRQALRRAGQEGAAGTVAPFANLPQEVRSDFRRLHEIETALAAGQMPPLPPDAGTEPQSASRAVPSRLPEALLRSTQVGGTGQKGRGGTHSPSPLFWDCPS